QRWDSFRLNTPNWANDLPGIPFHPERPNAFESAETLVAFLEDYAERFDLPVRTGCEVTSVRKAGDGFRIKTSDDEIETDAVVCASGCLNRPRMPECAASTPDFVENLTAADYDRASDLPDGAVLVAGSAQSGSQIAEDLLKAGRRVFLSTGKVGRIPRRYRGRDILEWLRDMGFFDMRPEDLDDPAAQHAHQPQISGTDGGHTLSLQGLAARGATLIGRVHGFDGARVLLGGNVADSIAHADEVSSHVTDLIDRFIEKTGRTAPAREDDPHVPPLPDLGDSDNWSELDLMERDVRTIIWCTGFGADWSWLEVDAIGKDGVLKHEDGIASVPGLYFIGFPWLATRKSGIIHGTREDSERIADHITRNVGA
ncbi:MAG: NAD(P)-binding domain-containing protein, partial [Rhodothermales bacterium]|nr:NAD(P)-binding domain-containing protein [Rhodothermales bacterium]